MVAALSPANLCSASVLFIPMYIKNGAEIDA